MNILPISDTHTFHNQLIIPKNIDIIIHSGDCSNHSNPINNHEEVVNFLNWYEIQNARYKIYVAGNHDTSIEHKLINKKFIESKGIIYLEHEFINIEGINIFGSPYTPTFGSWSFMKPRHKLDNYWKEIPNNTNILITHGPPKTILDLAYGFKLEYCGDQALLNHIKRIEPKYHIFGHIHDNEDCKNHGIRTISNCKTTFINASCVHDNQFSKGILNQPKIFKYEI